MISNKKIDVRAAIETDSNGFVTGLCSQKANMNKTQIYPQWRVLVIHIIAKLLGVLVHVDGMPLGSSRIYLNAIKAVKTANGGAIGSIDFASSAKLQHSDCKNKNCCSLNQ